ncbi:MAG TPA: sugar-binding transcriptional regulator [Chloroflexota bacterium]
MSSISSQPIGSTRRSGSERGAVVFHERDELLAEVASLYYEAGLDQAAIAERIGVSRSNISRMLSEARRKGLVEIRIVRPLPTDDALAREAVERFGLRDALVLDARKVRESDVLPRVGALAARYVETLLAHGDVLAISWGTALRSVAEAFAPQRKLAVEVVQMIGGAGSRYPDIDGAELARRFAERLGGRYRYLHAPLLVDSPATCQALLQEPSIRDVLDRAAQAKVAVVGIGSVEPSISAPLRAGYTTTEELAALQRLGVVGDVCGRHFDIHGRLPDIELNRRVIGLDGQALRRIPYVVGVAAGRLKGRAILGSLRSRLVNVLITDSDTLGEVLRLEARHRDPADP